MKFPLCIYRVAGNSMMPRYQPGDLVVGWRWFRPKPGQVAVVRSNQLLLKRIKLVKSNQMWLEGDNPNSSTDSRQFGFIPVNTLEAKVVARFSSNVKRQSA